MHKKLPPKPLSVMERVVPKSKKYANVQGVLDTGATVNKVKVVSCKEHTRRRDEIHYRLTKKQLSDLYSEYEQDEYESIRDTAGDLDGPKIVSYSESSNPYYEKPYLILDVRQPDAYNRCHLLQARSFPYTLFQRDQAPTELRSFKNKDGCLVIVYCDDERISRDVAKIMVDRGTDNIFLLTGGLMEFAADYSEFIEGG